MSPQRKHAAISLKELRTKPDEVAKRVSRGEIILVLKRSKPLFRLIKPFEDETRRGRYY